MNKLILITAALLTLTSAASAAEMPREFLGDWCESLDEGVTYSRNRAVGPAGNGCESHDSSMTVSASGITFHKGECAALKVQRRRGPTYHINFRCEGEPNEAMGPMASEQIWRLKQGGLQIEERDHAVRRGRG
jgi:hypothetical protein